ncbi:MAG: host attachment protein [Deltaproteobacteria bacterium]|nr:MAG: host attachment protein [Deltaproteobacteria bacterium]
MSGFPLPPKTRLLLVADGRRARFFFVHRPDTRLEPAWPEDLVVPDRPEAHVLSDEPATVHERRGQHRHGVGPTTPPHRMDEIDLARRAAETARKIVLDEGVDELYVVAAPRTLGDLREHFDKTVKDKIVREEAKDVSKLDDRALAELVDTWFQPVV